MEVIAPEAAGGPPAGLQTRQARALWHAAMAALALMPLGMAVAHRSSPVFAALAALLALAAVAAEGRLAEFGRAARGALASPLGLSALAFLAWCVLSLGWSEFRLVSVSALGEFGISVAAAFVLALTLPARMTRPAFWLLVACSVVACVTTIFELRTGLALRRSLGMRWHSFIFNRPVLTLLCLLPPVAAFMLRGMRHGWMPGLAFAGLVFAAMAHSESGASVLGFAAGAVTFLAALAAPRLVAGAAAVAFTVLTAAAPFLGPIADRAIPASVHRKLAADHSRDRVDIWISFGEVIRHQPFAGAGFGVSPRMRDTAVAGRVPSEGETLLGVGHPHNALIQIWAELGAVGAVLALAAILLLLRTIARQERPIAAASLALLGSATAVALVGHGAWQGWWAAALGAAIVWILAVRRMQRETGA
ncbi:O-antigen ligase family protein [Microvirga thermotolerans]|uniref:O-antigen ligase domain-containing protein n=1 Tax=Microvirga thermotolerans TaxID=2651334 RepID=A0A5P9JZ68_9HYPH|nr:O-antigen ligase family protein [Microvirga thermotolerans]QFU17028.1 O-antigen ligase domain-containing protein [Microvirga thermotolerans]